jgi:putative MATE family efflux protein
MDKQSSNTDITPGAEGEPTQQVNRLGTARISRLMIEFAIPSIIGLVANGLYNIIDSIFLGHGVGDAGLATATVATPIMIFSMAISILIGAGGNALVALRLGEGKHESAERVMGNTFTLTLIVAVVCTVAVNVFMDPVLALSGTTEDIWEYAHTFIRIISFGFILMFIGMGFNNFIRTAGDPNRALYTMLAGTAVCILLNWLFVMVLGWGIAGSAWATVIGQAVSAFLVLWYFTFSKKAPFKIKLPYMRLKVKLIGSICALGSAAFVLQIANVIINLLLNHQLVLYGAQHVIGVVGAQAAIGVVMRIAMFAFFPLLGVAMAAQPLLGFNYGARNFDRVKTTFKISFIWMIVIGVFFWLLIHIFPAQIVSFFGVKDELLDFTIKAVQVMMFLMPLIGVQILASNYFQSSGQPLKSMFLSLTRQLLYLIPLIYLMPLAVQAMPGFLFIPTPLDALYYSYPIADGLSVITASLFVYFEFRKLNRLMQAQGG